MCSIIMGTIISMDNTVIGVGIRSTAVISSIIITANGSAAKDVAKAAENCCLDQLSWPEMAL